MKWAEAKTMLSFVTDTRNSAREATDLLRPLAPRPRYQRHEDRGRREIGRGAGIPGIARVAQVAIQRRDCIPPGRPPHAAGGEHLARAALDGGCFLWAELAGDVGVRRRREQRQEGFYGGVTPRQAVPDRELEGRSPDLERRLKLGRVLAGDRIPVGGKRHSFAQPE